MLTDTYVAAAAQDYTKLHSWVHAWLLNNTILLSPEEQFKAANNDLPAGITISTIPPNTGAGNKFPAEIRAQIFGLLDIVTATIIQVVSRKWKKTYDERYDAYFSRTYRRPLRFTQKLSVEDGGRLWLRLKAEMWQQAKLVWDAWREKFVTQEKMYRRIQWVKEMPQREREERIEKHQGDRLVDLEMARRERQDDREKRNESRWRLRTEIQDEEQEEENLAAFLGCDVDEVPPDPYNVGSNFTNEEHEMAQESTDEDTSSEITSVSDHDSDSRITEWPYIGDDCRDLDEWIWEPELAGH